VAKHPEYIIVGRFGRPRNVFGEIYITPATDDPARFLELDEIFVVDGSERKKLRLEKVTLVGGRPVAKIEGYQSREEAAGLTNLSIEIPHAKALSLPEGSYYQFDLIGCRVMGADGTDYGIVEEVLFYPASDLYRIRSKRFGDVLLPAVDRFIVRVDIDKKEITIDPPTGLFEPDEDNSS
jgi:16S rRNA processing protein RimM